MREVLNGYLLVYRKKPDGTFSASVYAEFGGSYVYIIGETKEEIRRYVSQLRAGRYRRPGLR